MSHIWKWQFQLLVWQLHINSLGLAFLFSHSMSNHVTNDKLSEYLKPLISTSYFYMHHAQDQEIDVERVDVSHCLILESNPIHGSM